MNSALRLPVHANENMPETTQPRMPAKSLLQPGRNVWRVEHARRARVLVDGGAYFGAVRKAMLKARRSIVIVGWDIDSRTRLVGPSGEPEDGLPAKLDAFLSALVKRNADLQVKMLLWDYSVLYSMERHLLPVLSLRWNTPSRIEFCLDDELPLGASHHQKIVVIDDAVAFCGGLDLTIRRWDTPEHLPRNPGRVDPLGKQYKPFHDVQMMVDGDAALALSELVRRRWERAACEDLPPPDPVGDPWPGDVEPQFRDARVGIARTEPLYNGGEEVREVEALYLDMIGRAERTVYLENQFLTCEKTAAALVDRLRERPELEALLVAPKTHHTWLEHYTMLAGRIRFMHIIREAGMEKRVRLLYPHVRRHGRTTEVMVHSKVLIVDDALLRVGSSNLCKRSMGVDTECDLVIEALNGEDRAAVARVRDGFIAEHCGTGPDRVAALMAENGGSLFATLDALSGGQRTLRPIDDGELKKDELIPAMELVADPERPIGAGEYLADIAREGPTMRHASAAVKAVFVVLAIAVFVLAWRDTPLSEVARPERVTASLASVEGSWTPLVVVAVFVLAGLVVFPLTVLIAATAAAFGAWPGAAFALSGALASALVTYGVGRGIGSGALRQIMGPRINRVARGVRKQGILAVAAVRMVPVAPFTLVNMVAGASGIRVVDYMLGTALGLAPGILMLSIVGDQVFDVVTNPSWSGAAIFVGVLVVWAGLSIGLQKLVSRLYTEES